MYQCEALPIDFSEETKSKCVKYLDSNGGESGGGCSGSVFKGQSGGFSFHARNMDWYYDNDVSVMVVTPSSFVEMGLVKHASIGMALGKCKARDLKKDTPRVNFLPLLVDDGINDSGLSIQMNVIPYNRSSWRKAPGRTIPDRMLTRWALDNFSRAEDAARGMCENGYYSGNEYNYHWIVSDREKAFIVEDGQFRDISDRPYMTNFRCLNGAEPQVIVENDPYGMGLERYELIKGNWSSVNDVNKAFEVFNHKIRYSNAYLSKDEMPDGWKPWYTESCGYYNKDGIVVDYPVSKALDPDATITIGGKVYYIRDFMYDYSSTNAHNQTERWDSSRHGKWQTTWTLVFDRSGGEPKMHAIFQESSMSPITFNLDGTMA